MYKYHALLSPLTLKALKMDPIEGSETSANINQTLGIHPKIETVKQLVAWLFKYFPQDCGRW
jgi:hypothetical protein